MSVFPTSASRRTNHCFLDALAETHGVMFVVRRGRLVIVGITATIMSSWLGYWISLIWTCDREVSAL